MRGPRIYSVLFWVVWAVGAASAQSTDTVRYIEARDNAIEEFKAPHEAPDARLAELEHERLGSLQNLLRQAVGPFVFEGVGTEGTINLDTLSPDGDFGRLDGLEYSSGDGRTKVLVTTQPLVRDWLGKFYERPTDAVRDPLQVLLLESQQFLTQAWAIEDQHFTFVDRLPVSAPKGAAIAVAFLGELCAEDENYVPDTIFAVVVIGERVYLISQSLLVRLPVFSECDRRWQKLWDSGKDEAAASTFNQCYARHVTSRVDYKAALRQGQRLIDSLARSSRG